MKKFLKRALLIICCTFISFTLIANITCNDVDIEKFDTYVNWEKYEQSISEMYTEINYENDTMTEAMKNASKPVHDKYLLQIEEYNGFIIKYFQIYGINVKNELAQLKVMSVNPDNLIVWNGSGFGGAYVSGENAVYIAEHNLEDKEDRTYIHEVLHYLGTCDSNESMSYIWEGITEAICEEICNYNNIFYSNRTNYTLNVDFGLKVS